VNLVDASCWTRKRHTARAAIRIPRETHDDVVSPGRGFDPSDESTGVERSYLRTVRAIDRARPEALPGPHDRHTGSRHDDITQEGAA
jgi:hypothetical protein